jgi:uncharacterized membrane protein
VHLTSHFLAGFALAARPAWLTGASLWLNAAALALFVFGIVVVSKKTPPHSTGADRLIRLGRVFYTVSLAFFGMQHFALFEAVKPAVPAWMPWHGFWTYLVGAALIAACLSILTEIKGDVAALLLGVMFGLFVLMIFVPNLIQNPHDRFSISSPLRDLSLCAGALCLAWTMSPPGRQQRIRWLAEVGRSVFAVAILYFGVEQFLHPEFAPGVPLELMMPAWFPGPLAWSWFAGIVLVPASLCILIDKGARWAAIAVGIAYLVLVAFVYMPMEFVHPSIEISGELDYVANTLAVGGAAFMVAGAVTRKSPGEQKVSPALE